VVVCLHRAGVRVWPKSIVSQGSVGSSSPMAAGQPYEPRGTTMLDMSSSVCGMVRHAWRPHISHQRRLDAWRRSLRVVLPNSPRKKRRRLRSPLSRHDLPDAVASARQSGPGETMSAGLWSRSLASFVPFNNPAVPEKRLGPPNRRADSLLALIQPHREGCEEGDQRHTDHEHPDDLRSGGSAVDQGTGSGDEM